MNNLQLPLLCAFLALQALVCVSGNGLKMSLSALKPDLEYLREFWLQNPGERHREGRILFPNKRQIVVRFGAHANGEFSKNEAWKIDSEEFRKDAVQLINIQKMYKRNSSFNEPYYKHGTFYMPNEQMHNMTEPLLETGDWVEMLPIQDDVCDKPYVEIRYIDLNSLGRGIDVELLRSDFGNVSSTLIYGQNKFSVEYFKGDPFLLLRFVRIIEYADISAEESSEANFEFSIPYYFIPYDWSSGAFSSVLSDQVDGRSAVRSDVGVNYVLRECPNQNATQNEFHGTAPV